MTGASGGLGRLVVEALLHRDHEVVRISSLPGKGDRRADLATGAGLAAALAGAEGVVHTASAPRGDHRQVDAAGAGRLAAAVDRATLRHLVHVSIVGVDAVPSGCYPSKLAAEMALLDAGLPVPVLRATQFHDFVDATLQSLRCGPVLPVPAGWSLRPVDRGEVAEHLAAMLEGPASHDVRQVAGPDVLGSAAIAKRWPRCGPSRHACPLPVPGRISRAFRQGAALHRDGARGARTYEQHLTDSPASRS